MGSSRRLATIGGLNIRLTQGTGFVFRTSEKSDNVRAVPSTSSFSRQWRHPLEGNERSRSFFRLRLGAAPTFGLLFCRSACTISSTRDADANELKTSHKHPCVPSVPFVRYSNSVSGPSAHDATLTSSKADTGTPGFSKEESSTKAVEATNSESKLLV